MEQNFIFVFTSGAAFGIVAITAIRWMVSFLSGPSEKEQLLDEMLEDYKANGKLW